MKRLANRLTDDRGLSLIEVSVASILSVMIGAAMLSVFTAFSANSGDATRRAELQGEARQMIAGITLQLRQAIRADRNGDPIESMDGDSLTFYTTNYVTSEPERVVYQRTGCTADGCELWIQRYAMASTDGITVVFAEEPFETSLLLDGLLDDEPVFVGIEWSGEPPERVAQSTCDIDEGDCGFTVVGITIRLKPIATTSGSSSILELREEVRMRNA